MVNHTLYQGRAVKNLKINEKRQTLVNRNHVKKKRRRKHNTVVYETVNDFGEKTMISDLTHPSINYQHIVDVTDVSNYLDSPHYGIGLKSNEKEKALVKRKDK